MLPVLKPKPTHQSHEDGLETSRICRGRLPGSCGCGKRSKASIPHRLSVDCSLRLRSILLVDLLSPLLRSFLPFSVARITAASLQAWVTTEVTTVPHDILIVLMVGQHDALEIYTEIPSTTEMMDIIIQIMDEVANLSLTSVAIPRIERTSLCSWDCDKGGQAKPNEQLFPI